jgi:polyisoprenoid-binding protein YceI
MKTAVMSLTVFLSAALSASAFADYFKIDHAASTIQWRAGKKIGSFHNGDVKVKSGFIETDAKNIAKNGKVVADMTTIADEDLKNDPEHQKKLVGHLSSDDFFKVEKHPESTFELTSLTPKTGSADEYVIKGKLTLIGITQPIEFPARIASDKSTIKANAMVQIERLKWGLKYGSGSIFKSLTADKIINDSFELTLNLLAHKEKK